jgi:translation initiation factor IF-2
MITIRELAEQIGVAEDEIIARAISLKVELRARGKSVLESDAAKLQESFGYDEELEATIVRLPAVISIKELAEKLALGVGDILKVLMKNGVIANLNDEIDFDTASLIADELGFEAEAEESEVDEKMDQVISTTDHMRELLGEDDPKKLKPRPPVVTIMGHVDHGKTSLLDAIRQTNVWGGEEGGITQHIGAYQAVSNKRRITFLDTPGHEAFTAMRARGAKGADIVILVVAADDGVKPQTIEAINHAKAAGVPIIVAVNKIDKPGADTEKAKRELSDRNVIPEEWGGDTIFVNVSAKQKTGLDELLEMILLVADVLNLKANPVRDAVGTIIEAKKTPLKGVLATVLLHAGTLRVGDPILVGAVAGRVKTLMSDAGKKLKEVTPGMPAEIAGLPDVPQAGDILQVVKDDRTAQQLADFLRRKERAERLRPTSKVSLESFYEHNQGLETKTLNLILKADAQGSIEAIKDSLKKLETDEVKVAFIHEATGDINPSDITLAVASQAVIIGFHVKKSAAAEKVLLEEDVDIRLYSIIYKLIDDVRNAMGGLLSPEDIEIVKGRLEVRGVFTSKRDRWTIGGYVEDGTFGPQQKVRIKRAEDVIGEAEIVSLKRENTDVKKVEDHIECGMMLKKVPTNVEIKPGDVLEHVVIEKRKREL